MSFVITLYLWNRIHDLADILPLLLHCQMYFHSIKLSLGLAQLVTWTRHLTFFFFF